MVFLRLRCRSCICCGRSIELKDGSTVYIFKDGKMGMEDKYGHATLRMKKDTRDGNQRWPEIITAHGDEWN
ncbi:MAG: CopK family periplasmic copper-binding protein [Betaproteobacteria bacterium]|nr:CopK family periplasmic copper-binding protein [Betaproteobacteria bacterium]